MSPRGDLDNAELFDARGRLNVPKAILALLDASREMQAKLNADYNTLRALPCQMRATTRHLPLPDCDAGDHQADADRALGATLRGAWESIPHWGRVAIVLGIGAALAGGLPPALKIALAIASKTV